MSLVPERFPMTPINIKLPSHVYLTSRYLYVPLQGSPKIWLLAIILHEFLPSHSPFTIERDLVVDPQFVFEV